MYIYIYLWGYLIGFYKIHMITTLIVILTTTNIQQLHCFKCFSMYVSVLFFFIMYSVLVDIVAGAFARNFIIEETRCVKAFLHMR